MENLVGNRYGKLQVLAYEEKRSRVHYWRCLCDCGNESVVSQTCLKAGRTKSCGCIGKNNIYQNMGFEDGTSVAKLHARMEGKLTKANRSGANGVYQNKKSGKWVAQITFRGKTKYLGSFSEIEDAIRARKEAEEIYQDFLLGYNSK